MVVCSLGLALDLSRRVSPEPATQRRLAGSCPSPASPTGLIACYIVGVLGFFVGLAIITDDFFVPALDLISSQWGLSDDVAGATLMAAGGSAPELFTSAIGTFIGSSVGFGAIVGSAVFNILFVVGVCAILTPGGLRLTWYPIVRDSSYYVLVLALLVVFFAENSPLVIDWYEALILHGMYWLYVFLMTRSEDIKAALTGSNTSNHRNFLSLPNNFSSDFSEESVLSESDAVQRGNTHADDKVQQHHRDGWDQIRRHAVSKGGGRLQEV